MEQEPKSVELLDSLSNIYGWHKDKCAGHAHEPSCPVVKLRRLIIEELTAERERYERRERELVKKVEGMFLAWIPDDEEFMRNGTTERLDNEYNKALSDVIEVIQDQLINPSTDEKEDTEV
jgi:hypothetical protein